jgi:hypothetical protein
MEIMEKIAKKLGIISPKMAYAILARAQYKMRVMAHYINIKKEDAF